MPKQSIVCTLYEGDYHLGVGVLINSLHARDFSGHVCVGYRGPLPPWASHATPDGEGRHRLSIGKFDVIFFSVATKRHLTNYKPEFMLHVWRTISHTADYIYFFDADIFIVARWSYFEEWADAGLALVADGNTPMPQSHPVRVAWRRHYEPHGFRFARRHDYHYNGGFVGVRKDRLWVLESWEKIQTIMEQSVRFDLPISLPGAPEWQRSRAFPFFLTDQDALNIVADLEGIEVSVMGSEGMGWKQPADFMHHAAYGPKPWRKRYIRRALKGNAPSLCDFVFWQNAEQPVAIGTAAEIKSVRRHMSVAQRLAKLGAVFNLR